MNRVIFVQGTDGIRRLSLNDDPWLIDAQRDDDLAVLDVSDLGMEDYAIDIDNNGSVKVLKSTEFATHDVRLKTEMFAMCGMPDERRFEIRTGYYVKAEHGYHKILHHEGGVFRVQGSEERRGA